MNSADFIMILKKVFKTGVTMGMVNQESIMIKGELDLKTLESELAEYSLKNSESDKS